MTALATKRIALGFYRADYRGHTIEVMLVEDGWNVFVDNDCDERMPTKRQGLGMGMRIVDELMAEELFRAEHRD